MKSKFYLKSGAFLIVLLLCALPAIAQDIAMNFRGTVQQAIELLQREYNYSIVIKTGNIDLDRRVVVKVGDATIYEVLERIFGDHNVTYTVNVPVDGKYRLDFNYGNGQGTNRNDMKRRSMSPLSDSEGSILLHISHNPAPDITDTTPMRKMASFRKRDLGSLIIWLTSSSLAINAIIDRTIITYTVR